MLLLNQHAMAQAAAQIRAAESAMSATVRDLTQAQVWSGQDADRFEREWNDLVRSRLLGAAGKLDVVVFITS